MANLNSNLNANSQVSNDDIMQMSRDMQAQSNLTAATQMQAGYQQLQQSAINARTSASVNVSNAAKGINDKVQV